MRNSSSLFTRVRFLQTARKQLENRHFKRAKFQALLLRAAVYLAAAITAGVLLFVVGYILIKGIPHLSWSLFEWRYNSENVSLMPALLPPVPAGRPQRAALGQPMFSASQRSSQWIE